jgi:hypothetical protein
MDEVLRTNDPVLLSFAQAVLDEAGHQPLVMDGFMSAMDGSIGAIPRRLVVPDGRGPAAKAELDRALAELEHRVPEDEAE